MALKVGDVYTALGLRVDDASFERGERRLGQLKSTAQKPIAATAGVKVDERGFRQLNQHVDRAEKGTKRLGSGMTAAAGASLRFGAAATGIAGVGIVLSKAGGYAIGFQKTMSEVAAVTGANKKQLDQLANAAVNLGTKTGLGAGKAAQAIAELAKGGLTTDQIIRGGLAGAMSLAAAGGLELADAATATANALNLFGLDGSKATHVADAFATAANATTADVADFALALSQGGGAAKAAGLSFDQTTVALEALAANGVKGSDAGTSLKSALTQIASPTKQSAETMKQLNLQFFDSHGKMKNLADVSAMLRDRLGGMTKQQRLQAISTVAGTDGMRALLALYDSGPKRIEGFSRGLEKHGTAAEVARKKQDNFAGGMNKLRAVFEAISVQIGRAILPALGRFAASFATLIDNIRTGSGSVGRAIDSIKRVFSETFGGQSGIGKDLRTIIRQLSTFVSFIAEKVAAPIARRILPGIVQAFRGFAQIIKGVVQVIAGVLTLDFRKAWTGVKNIFSGGVKNVLGQIRAMTAPARAAAAAVGKAIGGAFSSAWNGIKSAATGFVNAIIGVLNKIPGVNIGKVGGGGQQPGGTGKGGAGLTTPGTGLGSLPRAATSGVDALASGGKVTAPVAIMGEEAPTHPEWVIPTNPAYRQRAVSLWMLAARELGIPGFALGGVFDKVGDVAGGAVSGVKKAASAVGGFVAGGAKALIGKLPGIPGGLAGRVLGGTFRMVKNKAIDYIKDKVSSIIPGGGAKGTPGGGGLGTFDGIPVANWIIPILNWARSHGWGGHITSGYRTHAHNVAQGRFYHSNHEDTAYPGGAVDVGGFGAKAEGQALAAVLAGYNGPRRLVWGGPTINDWGHFSASGHRRGGVLGALGGPLGGELLAGGLRAFRKGGKTKGFGKSQLATQGARSYIRSMSPIFRDENRDYDRAKTFVDDQNTHYGITERRYDLTDEELVDDNGNVNTKAIETRARELQGLIDIRNAIVRALKRAAAAARRAIRSYTDTLRALRASLAAAKGKERPGIRGMISTYEGRLSEWRDRLKEITGDLIPNAQLDAAYLVKEKAGIMGTKGTPAEDVSTSTGDAFDAGTIDTSSSDETADSGGGEPVQLPPTAEQIAEAAAAQISAFNSARADLFSSFGRNYAPAGLNPFAGEIGQAAGLKYYGAGGSGDPGPKVEQHVHVTLADANDTHTFTKGSLFELQAAI